MQAIDVMTQARTLLVRFLDGLEEDEVFAVPAGFRNDVAWNVGHVIVTQQMLHYRLAGRDMQVPGEWVEMFRAGTSPGGWTGRPDVDALKRELTDGAARLRADYEAGILNEYQGFESRAGFRLVTIEDALVFDVFHEGLHFGAIQSIVKTVRASPE